MITDAEFTIVTGPRMVKPTGWQQFRYVAFRLFQVVVWVVLLLGLADMVTSGHMLGLFTPELSAPLYHAPQLSDPVVPARTAAPPQRQG